MNRELIVKSTKRKPFTAVIHKDIILCYFFDAVHFYMMPLN